MCIRDRQRTAEDGSDLAAKLQELFQVLNTPKENRFKNLDEQLADFPYVNGKLFEENLPTASFDTKMLSLIHISIAIYSAVISTMDSQSIKLSSIFVNDLYSKFDNNINEDNIHQGKMVRVILPWIFVLGFAFSLILFAFETAFLFLSSIWVIGIASFGLLFVGLWWSRLRDIMISNKRLLKYDVTISTILVFLLIGYFLLKGCLLYTSRCV